MLEKLIGVRWFVQPALWVFVATFFALGAGSYGGWNYTLASTVVAPVLFAGAMLMLLRLEEKSIYDYVPLGCAAFIYLVMLGEITKICLCGFQPPVEWRGGMAIIGTGLYNMHSCFTLTLPLMAVAFGSMLLPPYNGKVFGYRFVAFVAAFMPFMALAFNSMSIGYRD